MPRIRTGTQSLPELAAADLAARIAAGEWQPGDRLPPEMALAEDLGVSRVTVRSALQRLEVAGLLHTRRGIGTFVSEDAGKSIRAGLEELRSMSATIRDQGREPSVEYRVSERRPADEQTAAKLERPVGSPTIYIERVLLADDQAIAFSYGHVAEDVLPSDFSPDDLQGSVFEFLAPLGLIPDYAEAAIRPVHDASIGWSPHRPESNLYLLLEQVQYLPGEQPLSWSQIYFIEDRFQFTIMRRRK